MPLKIAVPVIFMALFMPGTLVAQQGVVINEIMYAPHSPEPEWIELYNTDSVAIDLTDWQIATGSKSDSLSAISIAAQGYLVITKDSLELITLRPGNYAIAQTPLPDLDNTGSELMLKNATLQTMDSLDYLPLWGGSSGNSLERRNVLNSSTDPSNWGTSVASSGATPGARNSIATPDSTPIVISAHPLDIVLNEIMFAPISPEPEWIELLNTTSDTINIAGWILTVQNHPSVTVPSTNTLVAPDSLIVISSNDTELAAYRNVDIKRIVRCSLPDLSNIGSILALHDLSGNLIDSDWYNGNWIKADGISIERINPAHIGYDPTNWKACEDSSGSTIFRPNSVRIRNYDLSITSARPSDTSVAITIVNVGLDTVLHTTLDLHIGTFAPSRYP
jgi:Lamin Tail Domain